MEETPQLQDDDIQFADYFRGRYRGKIKDIPNLNYTGETLSFADYVMNDTQEWAYRSKNTDEINIEEEANFAMFDVYETWLGGNPEISIEKEGENSDEDFFCNVHISIPQDDPARQTTLALVVADALNERLKR